ncbi:MAG: aspartate carbamoyltransferase [Thermoflexales bacterium]|nr:aspartate carbamoyltransferase [Thermoflexales bacterium]MDW8352587.1 aspartate carbamoyltransferase [Anaerolineae bacterium]
MNSSNPLIGRDIISISDLTQAEICAVLDQARRFEEQLKGAPIIPLLNGRILATVFYEPSTRTRLSFESAMHRLGGSVISVADARTSSSAAKGESIYDSGKMLESYADVIVQRHPAVGSARALADAADVPVINAGDGIGEHPTQALLDLYTIERERGTLDGLTVVMAGDLKHGRTVHSLAKALAHWKPKLLLCAPQALAMPDDLIAELRGQGLIVIETENMGAALAQADVVYVTRIQQERFETVEEYMRYKGIYVLTEPAVRAAKPGIVVMHPLPRVDEISPDVDRLPNAAYFRQARYGVFVRMALLAMVLGAV